MANRYAVASGNWSNVAIWDGGTTLPGVGDSVRPNGYDVTIDQDITVTELRNDASAPAVASGTFFVSTIASTRTVNANLRRLGVSKPLMTISATSGTLNINGDIGWADSATAGMNVNVVNISGACTINIVGNVRGSGDNTVYTLNITAAAIITITGDVVGGPNYSAQYTGGYALYINAAAAVTINGNVSGYIRPASNGGGPAIYINSAAAVLDINGEVTATVNQTNTTFVPSIIQANCTAPPIRVTGPIKTDTKGYFPIQGNWCFKQDDDLRMHVRDDTSYPAAGAERILAIIADNLPATADVRAGTAYGSGGLSTGTLAVPDPGSVALGVATDDTTGTAALTPASVWDHLLASITTSDSIGVRLKSTATVDSTGAQIAAALDTP